MLATAVPESVARGTELRQEFLSSVHLGREVEISVLLPPGWQPTAVPAYPVLYLNDGQDLPRLQLQHTLDQLFAQGQLRSFVLVAAHANDERLYEYGVGTEADYNGRGNRAGHYTRFVLEELLPFAQRQYRAAANPAEAVLAGFSLGGLSAFDIVWHHPAQFARAGVFSGSFWWRRRALDAGYTPADRIMQSLVQAGQPHASHQFWLQTGTLDERGDRNHNGVIDAIDDCLDLIDTLISRGLDPHRQLRYVQVEGGEHHPDTWGRIMPDFLRWAFGQPAGLPAPLPVVRQQLELLAPLPPAAAAAMSDEAETRAHLLAVEAAVSTEILYLLAEPPTDDECADNLPAEPVAASPLGPPAPDEYQAYYAGYIGLVPAGTDPLLQLQLQAEEIQALFARVSEEQAAQGYAPGKWSSKELLLHLVDAERIFAYRALRFARGDAQELPGFDENSYAAGSGANARPLAGLLAEHAAVRAATLALFAGLTPEQLQRRGVANGAEVSVNALRYITAGHERHHLQILHERYATVLQIA